jgi:hypothetical protein
VSPLVWGVWLYASAAATLLPGAETAAQRHDDGLMLAGEPLGFAHLAIGLSTSEAP